MATLAELGGLTPSCRDGMVEAVVGTWRRSEYSRGTESRSSFKFGGGKLVFVCVNLNDIEGGIGNILCALFKGFIACRSRSCASLNETKMLLNNGVLFHTFEQHIKG